MLSLYREVITEKYDTHIDFVAHKQNIQLWLIQMGLVYAKSFAYL